jgi:hypothetical protein
MKRTRLDPAHINSVILQATSTFACFYAAFSTELLFSSGIHWVLPVPAYAMGCVFLEAIQNSYHLL